MPESFRRFISSVKFDSGLKTLNCSI